MAGWSQLIATPPPGPNAPTPLWHASPDAGLAGFPVERVGQIFAQLVATARERAAGRFTVQAGDQIPEQAPASTEGTPFVRLVPSALPAEPVCVSPDIEGWCYRLVIRVAIETSVGSADPAASMTLWGTVMGCFFPPAPELDGLGVTLVRPAAVAWGAGSAGGEPRCDGAGAIELTTYFDAPF